MTCAGPLPEGAGSRAYRGWNHTTLSPLSDNGKPAAGVRDGELVFPGEAFSARDNVRKLISFVASTEGELFAGQYHLLVTLNGDPVYADVVVVEVG